MIQVLVALLLALLGLSTTPTATPITPEPTAEATAQYQYAIFAAPADATDAQLQATLGVINARLTALNVDFDAPQIERGETISISIGLPGDGKSADWIALLTQPGTLELVDTSTLEPSAEYNGKTIWTTGQVKRLGAAATTPDGALINAQTHMPFKTIIDGTQVMEASVLPAQYGSGWVIAVTFNADASTTMKRFSVAHIGKPLAIVIDGKISSMPIIQAEISDTAWIQGGFTEQAARELAAQLSSGPLPIPLEFTSTSGER